MRRDTDETKVKGRGEQTGKEAKEKKREITQVSRLTTICLTIITVVS